MDLKTIHMVGINELKPRPNNRNKHPKEQIERLARIIQYQGFRRPIIVSNRSGHIVCGHGRLEAAKKLKLQIVPVIYQDYDSDEQEYADHVADNSLQYWAELDLSGINQDVIELGPDFDIDLLGIKDFVLEPAEKLEPGCDENEVPEDVDTRVKPGDIWQLGRHRLMCGDSTNIQHVEELMNGEKADMWLTDPPYGVAYKSKGTDKHRAIANDAMPLEEMKEFWQQVASNAHMVCSDQAAYYWFACQGGDQMMMMMSLGDGGWQVKHELIWLKDRMVLARCDYHYKHEPIIYGWKRGGTHHWYGDRTQTSVLEFPRPKSSDLHPTMKPVELVEYLMGNNSKRGDLVLETFGGSGTTLIAAEKSGRRCNAIELDVKYCDTILSRWEKYTGKPAERIVEGEHGAA
ncbi:MAG: site-specific DNA-methyltransferase [Bdellovibrionales bacterium]